MSTPRWAVVLAGGTGVRLSGISAGEATLFVPKQYCALDGRTLIEAAIARAERVVSPERVLIVVADEHRRFWRELFAADDPRLIVQPRRRGSAPAALLGLLHVLEREPDAQVTLLPADQTTVDEARLVEAIADAQQLDERSITLVGAVAEYVNSEYGWLRATGAQAVRLEEKPSLQRAIELYESGACWSTGIAVASGATWLAAFERALPGWVDALTDALACNAGPYRRLVLESRFDGMLGADLGAVFAAVGERLRCVRRALDGWADLESAQGVAPFVGRFDSYRASTLAN